MSSAPPEHEVIEISGLRAHMHLGEFHRDDGPALEHEDGTLEWFHHGRRHRIDGPARITPNGAEWWLDGERHRDDGPAADLSDGTQEWFYHGVRHRTDGPGVVLPDGSCEWWLDDREVSEPEWRRDRRTVDARPVSAGERVSGARQALRRRRG